MSFKQKFISAVTLAFAIIAFTTFVSAQDISTTQPQDSESKQQKRERRGFGKRGERGDKHRGGKMHGLEQLNLTDAQKTQIKSLMESSRTANQGTFQEMRDLKMKKRDGIITTEEQARMQQLKTQMKATAEQTHSSILAVLTPEQRAQLEQIKEQHKQQREKRREMRQNGQ
nr:Spy/CpxP family protein refolding chaperone [Acidobacteriota bacterium]